MKKVVLAGGCFWGVEAYFQMLKGVIETSTGYVDGNFRNPTYEQVCANVATHAEAVEVIYDENLTSIEVLLEHYLRFVDPFSINKQGHDIGRQYRTGIYVDDDEDEERVLKYFKTYFKEDFNRVQIKVKKNLDYDRAEAYHQKYLDKNPSGYCHVNLGLVKESEKK